jgi:hypothetical protein
MNQILRNIIPYGMYTYLKKRKEAMLESQFELVDEPYLQNDEGSRLRVFYLQDSASRFSYSFTAGRQSKTILWDRDNYRLPIHFYTHNDIFFTKKIDAKKFALLLEPETMLPGLYARLYKSPDIAKKFDRIFTHSSKLLNKYSNAALYLGQGVWYGTDIGGGELDSSAYKRKTKDVSMVSSNKAILASHRYRIRLAKHFASGSIVDTFGSFNGGPNIKISEALKEYRFSVVLENEISPYYFTEKLLNCFAAMTIPIYAGATDISRFFDKDGIIHLDKAMPFSEIDEIVASCDSLLYKKKIRAVISNYNKVLKLLCLDDHIFNEYKERFII